MGKFLLAISALFCLAASQPKPKGHIEAIQVSPIEKIDTSAQANRVRIGLHLTEYKKVLVRGASGKSYEKYAPSVTHKNVYRAKLTHKNHFHRGAWHIVTEPQSWDNQKNTFKGKIRFYRKFGELSNLEEEVGVVGVNGKLLGSKPVYSLSATTEEIFKDKHGNPKLSVRVVLPTTDQNNNTQNLSKKVSKTTGQ